ncbi:DUF3325 domain-containing protein [Sphingomonas sp. CFBP 13728]|uniref:DUF3325 domain-containing protein n=1 Tax=Sphingomonas sp. CFBP 13728 TaxID=2775294 RepID=UPI0017836C22|nr:DUF3325 domain-containing protein [Sphingomonas sp. CFBP 13728]MBD8619192.1 DUF3325 domain-containing protein [Sphingomonas sp. CFBP 13728]
MSVLSLMFATAAFVLLGLATDAHHRRRFGACPDARRRRMLRTGGWLALVASIVPAILARGWIFGPILCVGAIMAGAGIAFLTLNFIPARADPRPSRSSVKGL